jgi:hypothetical protein
MILLLLSLLFPIPFASAAVEGSFTPDIWHLETEVMLNGQELKGPVPSQSKLCFAPESDTKNLVCFLAGHANISKWTDSNITFVPPKNAPPMGVIVLVHPWYKEECEILYRKERVCNNKQYRTETVIGVYRAHPHITEVIDIARGVPATYLYKGETYEIRGYRFGNNGVGLYLEHNMMDKTNILRWTYDSIIFTANESNTKPAFLQVHNGAGRGNSWELPEVAGGEKKLVWTKTRGMRPEQSGLAAMLLAQHTQTGQILETASGATEEPMVEPLPFSDVTDDHPYADAVRWGMAHGIIQGYDDGTFRPDTNVNRAEFLKILFSGSDATGAEAPPSFKDVDAESWYALYVSIAEKLGAIEGYSDGTFRPEQPVTAAEALKIAYRVLQIPTVDPQGTEWHARYTEHASANGILFDTAFDPNAALTRKDILWMVWKLTKK